MWTITHPHSRSRFFIITWTPAWQGGSAGEPSLTIRAVVVQYSEECRCCRVFASDVDVGKNAELFYNITDGDPKFSIDENGYISTSTPLKPDEVRCVRITSFHHQHQEITPSPFRLPASQSKRPTEVCRLRWPKLERFWQRSQLLKGQRAQWTEPHNSPKEHRGRFLSLTLIRYGSRTSRHTQIYTTFTSSWTLLKSNLTRFTSNWTVFVSNWAFFKLDSRILKSKRTAPNWSEVFLH